MTTTLKPSLQRIEDARSEIKRRIAGERESLAPNPELISRLKKEKLQLKDMLRHLQLGSRPKINVPYVYNMMDSVIELLRQYLQDELATMLQGGKNESNREYVRVRDELRVVEAEQVRRTAAAEKQPEMAD